MAHFVESLHMIRDAYSMLYVHCRNMLSRSEWNIAGRTACDAMEKIGKSVEAMTGLSTTKKGKHAVRIVSEVIDRVPLLAWKIDDDPLESISFVVFKQTDPNNHIRVMKCVHGTLTQLAAHPVQSFSGMMLVKDGSTIRVFADSRPSVGITDTSAGMCLDGNWVQMVIDSSKAEILNKYVTDLERERIATGHYRKIYSGTEATTICDDGRKLFIPVKRSMGYRIGGTFD